MNGFHGTGATFWAGFDLVPQLTLGIVLRAGAILAHDDLTVIY